MPSPSHPMGLGIQILPLIVVAAAVGAKSFEQRVLACDNAVEKQQ